MDQCAQRAADCLRASAHHVDAPDGLTHNGPRVRTEPRNGYAFGSGMSPCRDQASPRRFQARAEVVPTGWLSDWSPQTRPRRAGLDGHNPKEHVDRHPSHPKSVTTLRPLLVAAVAAAVLAVPSHASAGPAPVGAPGDTTISAHIPASGGRTDEQFWGEATWSNPLSGLNLDRTSVAN